MNEEGDFVFKKFPPEEVLEAAVESGNGEDKPLETDPYAGTNIGRFSFRRITGTGLYARKHKGSSGR